MLEAKKISLNRGGKSLLDEIDICINSGKMTAIAGPNGAGKSSLLKILAGCEAANKGEVLLHGESIKQWSALNRAKHCGYLSQKPSVSFDFTVTELVALGRYPYRDLPGKQNQQVLAQHLELLGLESFKDRLYSSLSGGEQQRVHLARLLVQISNDISTDKKFLLLDEHMAHLDWAYQEWTFKYLKEVAAQGVGVVLVSHDIGKLRLYADEVILLKHGKVYKQGGPVETLTEPFLAELFLV